MPVTTTKHLLTTVSALPGKADEAEMIISTPTPDRDGDRVIPAGVDLIM